jgi:serine/threonine-protein kinase
MSGAPTDDPSDDADHASDEGLLSTVDAGAAVTPDAFLAEVARIPERSDVPLCDGMPRPGDTLGRFRVLSELGRGGMGVVYAAEDRTLGREVALKVLPTSDDERRRRFLREARSAAALAHANIATIYDVGEVEGRVFIAMELVRGRTLRAALDEQKGPLPLAEALRLAREIARALAQAHGRGVVHRDLKPENVMIAEDGQCKLLDFGLAKQDSVHRQAEPGQSPNAASVGGAVTTEEGRILGTPSYMSPEQAKGRPVDARSDVFSFGVMLYELCTGARPFAGGNAIEIFIALDRDEPVPPSRRNEDVPGPVERVIVRCLRKDPAARYADAGALLRDLERAAARPRRARRRMRLAVALCAVVALVVAARLQGQRIHALFAPPALPIDALPMPSSTNAAALAAYREGLESARNGGNCQESYERAVELDPNLGAAHVQLAAMGVSSMNDGAREHLRKAQALLGTLSERDRALVDAIEPVVQRQPSDWAEGRRRLNALIERSPGDAQLWHLLGLVDGNFDDFEGAVRDLDRALAIDPSFAEAESFRAICLAYLGRFAEARAGIDRCLAHTPRAMACLSHLAMEQNEAGSCEAMESAARRIIAATDHSNGYFMLANALAARGRPVATVREALRQGNEGEEALPAVLRQEHQRMRVLSDARLAVLQGDFEQAERNAREYAALVASSTRQAAHGAAATLLASILEETGRTAEAGQVALEFLDRRDAWEPEPSAEDMALAKDATPELLRTALRGGRLGGTEVEARRNAWLAAWKERVTPAAKNYLWMYAYARVADGLEDARAALDVLPSFGPLPPFRPETLVDADVGRTYLLAGRAADAIPWLEHASQDCLVLWFPFDYVRAHLLLGQAREARGDKAGACAAYRLVLDRWGQAKPGSVTAKQAKERADALGCGA